MILIKSGRLVTAERSYEADILIDGETIWAIGANLEKAGVEIDEVIDAAGKLILPGGIDPHVHLDLPMFDTVSSDDHYTGHKAAAFGGTTTVMDFVPQPDTGTLAEGVAEWHAKADHISSRNKKGQWNTLYGEEQSIGLTKERLASLQGCQLSKIGCNREHTLLASRILFLL